MAEVREFALPDLGEGLTEATIVRWLVEVGDVVAVDEAVVEVETAKAMVDVPCPHGGVVTARYGDEGDEVPVGSPLVTVAVGASSAEAAREGSASADEGSGNVLVGYGTQAPAERRKRVRSSSGGPATRPTPPATRGAPGRAVPAEAVPTGAVPTEAVPTGRGRHERGAGGEAPAGRDRQEQPGGSPVAVISPLVRRLAREHGVDLRNIAGSGPEGLVLRADVEQAVQADVAAARAAPDVTAPAGSAAPSTAPSIVPSGARADSVAERIPLRGLRGTVAEKLSRSRREIPDATCWVDADATELLAARRAMNAHGGDRISLLAVLARICTAALDRYPELNSTVDTEAREIVRLGRVHLGFAAQTDRGLVVPVVRDAHAMGAEGLSAEIARLTESARAGTLTPGELTGGTFTLNNYGVFGVDGSTPILNHPEAAMLGVGRIVEKPWVVGGELAVRSVVQLSFTFDHRVCDGGTAGGFLRHVADCVEAPAVLLRTL